MKEARSEISHWSEYDYILQMIILKSKKNILKIIGIEKIKEIGKIYCLILFLN